MTDITYVRQLRQTISGGDRQPDRRYPREATQAAWIRFTSRLPSREAEKRLYSRQFGSQLGTDR